MSKRILLVDDNEQILKLLELILNGVGYEVRCALSGNTALVVAGNQRIDLVVSDIQMSDGDGFQLLAGINQLGLRIPVIFMTGGFYGNEEEILKNGIYAILAKPLDTQKLLKLIASALSSNCQARKELA